MAAPPSSSDAGLSNSSPTPGFPALLIALSGLLAFLPALFGKTVVDRPETLDIANQWLGFAHFLRETYLAGRFPLWNPHDFCGAPFLAFAHTSSLYPPHVIVHLLFASYTSAHAVLVFIHLALASTGTFILLRGRRIGNTASAFGAIAYAFAGFLFGNINFPPTLYTASWLPLFFASALELIALPRASMLLGLALSFAAMVLGGDLEMSIFAVMVLGFELLVAHEKSDPRTILPLTAALSLGGILAPPLILPALELQANSIRAAHDFMPDVSLLPLLAAPVLVLFPNQMPPSLYPANHGLDYLYLGGFLALFALAAVRGPERRRLLVFPAAALYLVLFYVHPFNVLFHRVPLLGGIQVPLRMWAPLSLVLISAAAQALDRWISDDAAPFQLPGGKVGAALLLILGLARFSALSWNASGPVKAVHLIAGSAFIAIAALALAGKPGLPRARIAFAVAFIDLFALSLVSLPMTDPQRLEVDPRVRSFLENTAGKSRYHILSIRGIIDPVLPYHLGLRLNADAIDGFSRVPTGNGAKRLALLYPNVLRFDRGGRLVQYDQMGVRDPRNLSPENLGLLSKLNVAWVLSRHPAPDLGPDLKLQEIASWPDLHVYRNLGVMPRALSNRSLSDSYYPGWTARQGERSLRIECDDLGNREVSGLGSAAVTMTYRPQSFRIGLFAGLAALAAAIFFGLAVLLTTGRARL